MLYLNNALLTSERIIAYVRDNQKKLKKVPEAGSKAPSNLSQLKDKLKSNFFLDLVGCDLTLISVPPGKIDLTSFNQRSSKTPIVIKQDQHYFVCASSKTQGYVLIELSSRIIIDAPLDFPDVGEYEKPLPYNMQYQGIYNEIASQNNQKQSGCDLLLATVSAGEIDLSKLDKATPTLVKQGEDYYIYGRSVGKKWELKRLYSNVVPLANLDFPAVDEDAKALVYSGQYKRIYDDIASTNNKIRMDKTTELTINFK